MFHKIAKTVKTITLFLLNIQGQFLQKVVFKRLGYEGRKSYQGCTIELTAKEICDLEKVNEEVELILKTAKNDAEAIVKFFEEHKTPVYRIKNAEKTLKKLGEKEGFITERTGLKALKLNRLTTKSFSTKTSNMVITEAEKLDIYILIRALHKWCAFKNGLEGFDEKSQRIASKFDNGDDKKVVKKLSLKEIEMVRNATARDVQSIDFVVKYAKEHAGSKNVFEKMQNDGGANL